MPTEGYSDCRVAITLEALVTDKGLSEYAQVRSGVPQGSILCPTLLLLFLNDLTQYLHNCAYYHADNTTFHTQNKHKHTIESRLPSDFKVTRQ